MLSITCENCGKTLEIGEEHLGKQGRCYYCKQPITVRAEAPMPPSVAPRTNPYPSLDEEPKSSEWYYSINKNPKGPVSEAQMYSLIADKAVDGDTLMWQEGFPKWIRLSDTIFGQFIKGPAPLTQNSSTLNIGLPDKFQLDHNTESGVGLSRSNIAAIGHVATKTNVMAVVALVLALAGFFTGVTFLPAIVCGHLSLAQYRKNPAIGGESAAKAALAISYVIVILLAACFAAALVVGIVNNMNR